MRQRVLAMLLLVFLTNAGLAETGNPPVAKLMQPSGKVEYSTNGSTWRLVPRIKYLFEGYMVRTGDDGAVRLVNQKTAMAQTLSGNSTIEISDGSVLVKKGELSRPREDSTSIWRSLLDKFALAQKYTTVRRGITRCDAKVRTPEQLTLSATYPDLVWRNACPEYRYRLLIDDRAVEIPPQATAEMIRYSVEGLKSGEHTYKVEVVDVDGTIFSPRKASQFVLLSRRQDRRLRKDLGATEHDVYLSTALLNERDMLVASMDLWRAHFESFPDDSGMRPMLAEVYARLRLDNLRDQEARLYQSQSQ